MTTQGVGRVLARIQEIQSRVTRPPAAGRFQAELNTQIATVDSAGVSSLATILPATAGMVTIGELIGATPSTRPHPVYPTGETSRAELLDNLGMIGMNSRNGRLNIYELGAVSGGWQGRPGSLLPPAANAWETMRNAAVADGIDLQFVDTYRSWDVQDAAHQRYLSGQKQQAVLPAGTSQHGLGLAVDLSNGALIGQGDPQWQWMQANGPSYGWYPINNETWHWEYRGI